MPAVSTRRERPLCRLLRWAVPKLCRLIYPIFLHLNESFDSFPFAQRVAADERGFYRAVAGQLPSARAAAAPDGQCHSCDPYM